MLSNCSGGAIYADIEAATKPYGLAVPWGDAEQTGMLRKTALLVMLDAVLGHLCSPSHSCVVACVLPGRSYSSHLHRVACFFGPRLTSVCVPGPPFIANVLRCPQHISKVRWHTTYSELCYKLLALQPIDYKFN